VAKKQRRAAPVSPAACATDAGAAASITRHNQGNFRRARTATTAATGVESACDAAARVSLLLQADLEHAIGCQSPRLRGWFFALNKREGVEVIVLGAWGFYLRVG
jgi:hypothetical protein